MTKKYSAAIMIESVCYDAIQLAHKGDSRSAFRILKSKLEEIEQKERNRFEEVIW